ncbi:MAG: 1-deoxy-D-xylulose-5-phosphate reductoisomerase [Actinomycetota bacterium]|jgi:1-deoxy-D-xylulose-5-phosphate reductoisomerase|nr:1-deoxy-D-xylulose-5-phosphate reductoisomerase [Actinomycetota bacterium]
MRTLSILGSTGSIGTQALDVVRHHADRFKVAALSAAGTSQDLLAGQIREFLPPVVAIAEEEAARDLKTKLGAIKGVELLVGPESAETVAREVECDMVVNALVGSAGLAPTLAALQNGKTLALANKESLVVGGELVMDLIKGEPERLLPVDSEHAALAQALRGERREDLKRVILTGSGGPFRGWTRSELAKASVKEALQHPVWTMGPKITIDSATLMNKGLEVIEAHYLFHLEYSQIHVVIHPQGMVHAIAEFRDGSMRAEMAVPDMKLPIQLALAWPERLSSGVASLPLTEGALTFEPVDREAFPAIDLAYRVGGLGLTFPAVMNAANEVAVMAFLEGKIPLTRVVEIVQTVVDEHEPASVVSVVHIERADGWARRRAAEIAEER